MLKYFSLVKITSILMDSKVCFFLLKKQRLKNNKKGVRYIKIKAYFFDQL